MLFSLAEMAYLLDPDLPSIQLLGEHTKHCRLCCMTHVCDDIWKKFEVFPTPPVSPSPEPDSDCDEYDQEMVMFEYDVDKQMLEWEEACQNMKANLIQVLTSCVLCLYQVVNIIPTVIDIQCGHLVLVC